MKILSKCIGLMAVFCVIGGANAELRAGAGRAATNSTGRVSLAVNPTMGAINRLPTVRQISSTTTTSTTTSDSSLMDTNECVDAYTECIKATDVCGFDFEECTTHELFYAKKPQCNNVLLQCSTAGINTLFGTTSITNLTADNIEVYPTQGSILGQFIEAGAINNRLDKSSCVKRYTSCLKKENVCGEDFELCTSDTEFKKQKIYCESTLARCTDDGKTELFGQTNTDMAPKADSRLRIMITEGAQLAANNAVSTCYKVADQCILSACSANPYKCIVDSSFEIIDAVDNVNGDAVSTRRDSNSGTNIITTSVVSKYLRSACEDVIGGNKYCYMTVKGDTPTPKDLVNEELREDVYSDIYANRMNTTLRNKIQSIADAFDQRTLSKCSDTITACAMRSCGSGLGSACYKKVFGKNKSSCFDDSIRTTTIQITTNTGRRISMSNLNNTSCSINGKSTYPEIKIGCESIVNTDANCKYAAASIANDASNYSYTYNDAGVFTSLFPQLEENTVDPIGVVTRLNASLAENYNDAAIEKMAKDCKNTAVSCIRSLCGADFTNCYRNRTDVMADGYDTDVASFDKSMNKLGGVLDFNIIRGLCVSTVKDTSACDEHLKIQAIKNYTDGNGSNGWGDSKTVRDAWVDAVKGYTNTGSATTEVLMGCRVKKGTSDTCDAKADNINLFEDCGYVDEDGCIYDVEYTMSETDYSFEMSVNNLFQEVLGDIELEAQAKYNAKLTAEQNMCIAANSGGIMGNREMSSTYQWVKLRSKRIPKNYSTAGLKVSDFVASNDLYGSFCRARVTIQSDDPDIQSALQQKNQNWSTAYFAVGDVFTCGSWIPQDKLQEIAEKVAAKKLGKSVEDAKEGKMSTGQKWATAAATIGSAGLGVAGMELLQSKTGLGGLLNTSGVSRALCNSQFESARDEANGWIAQMKTGSSNNNSPCGDGIEGLAKYKLTIGETIKRNGFSQTANKRNLVSSATSCLTRTEVDNYLKTIDEKKQEAVCGKSDATASAGWRIGADVIAGGAMATLGGLATGQNIKAANRQRFTEAQQEFMNNVGNHIYCFIGADEAGTYGDLIEISVD